jgi:peptidoglycan/LPS O-acetylase OafA/YrhL
LVAASAYRPDIDGLRSIAVAGVVLFHAGLTALPGGYVGVDVFFVISGYLITRQVVSGVQRSSFSFAEFYLRRARRLLPVALVTIAATVAFALVFLSPTRIAEIAKSAAAASLSVSNIYFWQESGYWAESSASQPLLHTWSLSVEEQFYLVWPLFIFLLLRRLPKLVLPILIAGTVLSVAVTTHFSIASPDAAFYLTPFRAYEFAIGALCVWAERWRWPATRFAQGARSGSWVLGLALIVFAMLTFDEQGTTFPGWLALVPTIGTALMILSRRPDGLDGLLSNGFMRYIGLRSYSIYLVHWPVLVFAQELHGELTLLSSSLCIALTVVIAEVLYRFVERPFRIHGTRETGNQGRRERTRRFVTKAVPALGIAVVLGASSLGVWWTASRPEAYSAEVRPVIELDHDALNAERRIETNALCEGQKTGALCGTLSDEAPNVLVLGDSIGPEGFLFAKTIAPDANFLTGEEAGCPPLLNLSAIEDVDSACLDFNTARLADTEKIADSVDVIVLSMRLTTDRSQEITELLDWLGSLGPEIAVLGMGAHYDQAAWQTIAESGDPERAPEALHSHLDVTTTMNDEFEKIVTAAGAYYLDRWDWTCDSSSCRSHLGDDITDLVMVDTAHMTRNATIELARALNDDPAVIKAFSSVY